MALELENKVVFLTGGAQGIGRECALAYARQGAHVIIADTNLEAAQETAGLLEARAALAVRCDISRSADVQSAIHAALQRFGRLDAVHNNAAIGGPTRPLHETNEAEWEAVLNVNLKSVYLTTYHAFRALKDSRGCILNTASMVGLLGQPDHAAYVASKGGLIALTKGMALDYAPYGIRVNAICPAAVWTPLLRQWAQAQPAPEQMVDYLNEIHALGYCPEADVIADAAVFLLSERARFITGVALPVSGGAELGYRRTPPSPCP